MNIVYLKVHDFLSKTKEVFKLFFRTNKIKAMMLLQQRQQNDLNRMDIIDLLTNTKRTNFN